MASLNPSTSKPTMKVLMNALASVYSKYYNIGIQLEVPEDKIKGFEENHKEVDRRFSAVLSYWREENTDMPVNWESIIEVLQSRSVTENRLANELREEYISKYKEDARSEATDQSQSDLGYESQPTVTGKVESVDTCTSSHPQPPLKLTDKHKSDVQNEAPDQSQSDLGYGSQISPTPTGSELMDTSLTLPLPASVKPLFELKDGHTITTPDYVFDTLKILRHKSFRPGQEEAVMNILSGVSTLVIQPPASGKSLCYQIPAYLYAKSRSPCITLVISPLIALMEDQVRHFPEELKGKCLHANQTLSKRKEIMRDVIEGNVYVLLVSPETLVGGAFWTGYGDLKVKEKFPPVAFACIDEVHCVSEWSHNFRASYFQIRKVLRDYFGIDRVLGLTATATHKTVISVAKHFNIKEDNIIEEGKIVPDNLHISVSCDNDKDQALLRVLQYSEFKCCKSMIIYCTRRNKTEDVAKLLGKNLPSKWNSCSGNESDSETTVNSKKRKKINTSIQTKRCKIEWNIEHYHAGMESSDRQKVQDGFMKDEVNIIVATNAFGMGINKPDVRAIIHYDMPKSFESFVQEIGRAGRDGKDAYCHVFIDEKGYDIYELRRFAYNSTTEMSTLKTLMKNVFQFCTCPEVSISLPSSASNSVESLQLSQDSQKKCAGHEVTIHIEQLERSMNIYRESISTLLCYLELENKLKITSVFSGTCVLRFPLGESQLRDLGQDYRVVAEVTKLSKNGTALDQSDTMIKFLVDEIAQSTGQKSFSVYTQLTNLHLNQKIFVDKPEDAVSVELSGHQFHIQSCGIVSCEELGNICTFLAQKVKEQEEKQVEKLHVLHAVLSAISKPIDSDGSDTSIITETDTKWLIKMIQRYFGNEGLDLPDLEKREIKVLPIVQAITPGLKEQVKDDVQELIPKLRPKQPQLSERTIARIFQGIQSPLFSALAWSKSGFWRKYMSINFNDLCHCASEKL